MAYTIIVAIRAVSLGRPQRNAQVTITSADSTGQDFLRPEGVAVRGIMMTVADSSLYHLPQWRFL